MGALEEGGKVASGTIEALKGQPLALALVVINVLFLIAGGYFMHMLAGGGERKDQLLAQLAKDCIVISPLPKGDKQ